MKRTGIAVLLILALSAGSLYAQAGPGRGYGQRDQRGPRHEMIRERMDAIRMWRLTEELALSEDQSTRFFPRYNEFQDGIREINNELRETLDYMDEAIRAGQEDSVIEEMMQTVQRLENQRHERQREFINDLDDILTVTQRATLMIFETHFGDRMKRALMDMRDDMPPGPPDFQDTPAPPGWPQGGGRRFR